MNQTAVRNRIRYTLLCDRRRALFELHKLMGAVQDHPRWAEAIVRYPGLAGLVTEQLEGTSCELCSRACQASNPVLSRDVCRIYQSLSTLARVWTGLEDGRDLEPLLQAHYDALF